MSCNSVATARAKVSGLTYQQTVTLLKLLYPARGYTVERQDLFTFQFGANDVRVYNRDGKAEVQVANVNGDRETAQVLQTELTGKLSKAALTLIAKALQAKANVTKSEYVQDGRGLVLTVTTR